MFFNRFWQLALVFIVVPFAIAQTSPSQPQQDRGLISVTSLESSFDSDSHVLKLDSNLGYQFNRHFALSGGVPLYFASAGSSTTTSQSSTNGIGAVYGNLIFMVPSEKLNFSSTLTFTAPTGDSNRGLSTGHATATWNNRVEHEFGKFTPFGEFVLANTIQDSRFFKRPFVTYGTNLSFTGGGSFDLGRGFSLGASGYAIEPTGTQRIYSKVHRGAPGLLRKNRIYEHSQLTVGSAALDRDHGASAWISFDPTPLWSLEAGINHSTNYDLNTFSVNLGFNIGKLLRAKRSM